MGLLLLPMQLQSSNLSELKPNQLTWLKLRLSQKLSLLTKTHEVMMDVVMDVVEVTKSTLMSISV